MARIYQRTPDGNITDQPEINDLTSTESITYEEAFTIIRNYIQFALNKPYTDISITYAYLDILGAIKKIESKIKK